MMSNENCTDLIPAFLMTVMFAVGGAVHAQDQDVENIARRHRFDFITYTEAGLWSTARLGVPSSGGNVVLEWSVDGDRASLQLPFEVPGTIQHLGQHRFLVSGTTSSGSGVLMRVEGIAVTPFTLLSREQQTYAGVDLLGAAYDGTGLLCAVEFRAGLRFAAFAGWPTSEPASVLPATLLVAPGMDATAVPMVGYGSVKVEPHPLGHAETFWVHGHRRLLNHYFVSRDSQGQWSVTHYMFGGTLPTWLVHDDLTPGHESSVKVSANVTASGQQFELLNLKSGMAVASGTYSTTGSPVDLGVIPEFHEWPGCVYAAHGAGLATSQKLKPLLRYGTELASANLSLSRGKLDSERFRAGSDSRVAINLDLKGASDSSPKYTSGSLWISVGERGPGAQPDPVSPAGGPRYLTRVDAIVNFMVEQRGAGAGESTLVSIPNGLPAGSVLLFQYVLVDPVDPYQVAYSDVFGCTVWEAEVLNTTSSSSGTTENSLLSILSHGSRVDAAKAAREWLAKDERLKLVPAKMMLYEDLVKRILANAGK